MIAKPGTYCADAARQDDAQSRTETFSYDNLNRLTQASIAGLGAKTYAYNAIGNLTSGNQKGQGNQKGNQKGQTEPSQPA